MQSIDLVYVGREIVQGGEGEMWRGERVSETACAIVRVPSCFLQPSPCMSCPRNMPVQGPPSSSRQPLLRFSSLQSGCWAPRLELRTLVSEALHLGIVAPHEGLEVHEKPREWAEAGAEESRMHLVQTFSRVRACGGCYRAICSSS